MTTCSGEFQLFNPSSTTFVKNYRSNVINYHHLNLCSTILASAMQIQLLQLRIKFAMDNAKILTRTIVMYGVK